MNILKKLFRYVCFFLIFVVIGQVTANLLTAYVQPHVKGKESTILAKLIHICTSHRTSALVCVVLAASILVVYSGVSWLRRKRREFKKTWKVYKTKKLTPRCFRIQGYKKTYIRRESNSKIRNLLLDGRFVLIIGKPKIGKTRAAYEEIKDIKGFSVVILEPEEIDVEKIKVPPLSNKNFVLFLDDLRRFIDINVDDIITRLEDQSKTLILAATCRTGEELDAVKDTRLTLYRQFAVVQLEEIDTDQAEGLAKDARLAWKPAHFDGTPGSVTLDLEDMKLRYRKAGDGKVVLKALKLLKEGGLYRHHQTHVRGVCKYIFEVPAQQLLRHNWDEILNYLKHNSFITVSGDNIDIYQPYLDICVDDYEPTLNDLMKLKKTLVTFGDSGCLFYLGISFYHKQDFKHARDCYFEALRIYPEYAAAHDSLGYALTKLGEAEEVEGRYGDAERLYQEAGKEHREAITIDPHYAGDHNNLGYALTKLGEMKEIRGKHDEANCLYEEALDEHRKAIDLKPGYSSAHHSAAYALTKLGRYKQAKNEFRKAITLDPESPFAHNLLGHLLAVRLDKPQEAEREYREAIRIKPDYPSAHNNFGYLLAQLGRCDEAEEEYKKAIDAFPNYAVAHVNLARLLSGKRDYEGAAEESKKALRINPDYAEAHDALGYALTNLKQFEQAQDEYRKAISLRRDYVEAHRNLAYSLARQGEHEKAAEEYRETLQVNSCDEDALIGLAISLEQLGKYDEGENCYRRVITRYPESAKARRTYGYFLSNRDREDEALKQFEELMIIDPDDSQVSSLVLKQASSLRLPRSGADDFTGT